MKLASTTETVMISMGFSNFINNHTNKFARVPKIHIIFFPSFIFLHEKEATLRDKMKRKKGLIASCNQYVLGRDSPQYHECRIQKEEYQQLLTSQEHSVLPASLTSTHV